MREIIVEPHLQDRAFSHPYLDMAKKTWCNFRSLQELPPQLAEDHGKLTVVLDIDETLVHTELVSGDKPDETDTENSFIMTLQGLKLLVRKRPFLDSFLREAAKKFELIAFTAGAEDYAGPLLDNIDPERKYFRHRLYRQHCMQRDGVNFVKDLRVLNRSLCRTVLVDNNAHSFFMQLENGIPIASYFDDTSDKALITLFHFLDSISCVEDVRFVLNKVFGLGAAFGGIAHQPFIMQQA